MIEKSGTRKAFFVQYNFYLSDIFYFFFNNALRCIYKMQHIKTLFLCKLIFSLFSVYKRISMRIIERVFFLNYWRLMFSRIQKIWKKEFFSILTWKEIILIQILKSFCTIQYYIYIKYYYIKYNNDYYSYAIITFVTLTSN